MKIKSVEILPVFFMVLLVLFSSAALTQELPDFPFRELSKDSLLVFARTIIDSASSGTLITVNEQGKPQARTMSPFPPEENFVIWLGTSAGSRKVKQIKDNPHVIVFYYDSDAWGYVSVAGQARIVNDPEKKKQYWKESWIQFYPDPEKNYVLIEVTPERLEICSFKYKLFWDSSGKPAYVEF